MGLLALPYPTLALSFYGPKQIIAPLSFYGQIIAP